MSRSPKKKRANVSAAVLAAAALLSVSGPLSLEAGRAPEESVMVAAEAQPKVSMRTYQLPVFTDHTTKVLVVEQSRQTGKTTCAGNWAVDRLHLKLAAGLLKWDIIVLSNSKANGSEFARRTAEAARAFAEAHAELQAEVDAGTFDEQTGRKLADLPGVNSTLEGIKYEDMKFEVRVVIGGRVGRVLILAANARTARGFSGDLILDEFAFHEDAPGIWEAAEPIISANPDFLCRIMSTHNGETSLFNRWIRTKKFPVYSVKRSEAWGMGQGDAAAWRSILGQWLRLNPARCLLWLQSDEGRACLPTISTALQIAERKWGRVQTEAVGQWLTELDDTVIKAPRRDLMKIASLSTMVDNGEGVMVPKLLRPEEAEAEASDRRAYRQNYENDPSDAAGALLPWPLIQRAEKEPWKIEDQRWGEETLRRLALLPGELYVGQDVGRAHDLSVVVVLQRLGNTRRMVGLLRMADVSLPDQRREMQRLLTVCGHSVRQVCLDCTGLGLGLYEELHELYGSLIVGINFSSTVPISAEALAEGRKATTMAVTEAMALALYRAFDDGTLTIFNLGDNSWLRDCLRKPGRVVSSSGKVSIASERTKTESGHKDHADAFWALALAGWGIDGGFTGGGFRDEDFDDGGVVTGKGTAFGGGGRVDFSARMEGPVSEKPGTGTGAFASTRFDGLTPGGSREDTTPTGAARLRVFKWGSKPFNWRGCQGGAAALTLNGRKAA